jgi:hypothetical protein
MSEEKKNIVEISKRYSTAPDESASEMERGELHRRHEREPWLAIDVEEPSEGQRTKEAVCIG